MSERREVKELYELLLDRAPESVAVTPDDRGERSALEEALEWTHGSGRIRRVDALTLRGFAGPVSGADIPVLWHGPWQTRFEAHDGRFGAFGSDPACSLQLRDIDGPASLVVMCTGWSGMLEMSVRGESVIADTYAPEHTRRVFPLPGNDRRDVTLRVLSRRHPDAQDTQIWIHALLVAVRPTWLARDQDALSTSPNLIDAQFESLLGCVNSAEFLDKNRFWISMLLSDR